MLMKKSCSSCVENQTQCVTERHPHNAFCYVDVQKLSQIGYYCILFNICVFLRAGGGWGPPSGISGSQPSAVGTEFSASGLILVGLIIGFMS